MLMPPEHCHSCTLHAGMVVKSNSSCCVCLDVVPSPALLCLAHQGHGHFQSTHVLEGSHGTLQGLITMQLKWQLECFLHLFKFLLCFFEKAYVYFVCSFMVCYGWTICFYWLTPAFSRVQSRNLNSRPLVTPWPDQDFSLPSCFCMNSLWLAPEGSCTSTLHSVTPALEMAYSEGFYLEESSELAEIWLKMALVCLLKFCSRQALYSVKERKKSFKHHSIHAVLSVFYAIHRCQYICVLPPRDNSVAGKKDLA